MSAQKSASPLSLQQEIGLGGAILLGLGSMLGSGVFVSIAMAENLVGIWVLPAILLAAVVALCNGLSSAQCAASHVKAGGTYEYGYAFISPFAGFAAGWLFLLAKSASAATAALAVATYGPRFSGADFPVVPLALGVTALMTALVVGGVRRSNWANGLIVAAVAGALIAFIGFGSVTEPVETLAFNPVEMASFGYAAALIFVAFTGYGRIATMAEEVREPRAFIPPAIVTTVALMALLYLGVGYVVARHGGAAQADVAVSLGKVAAAFGPGWLQPVMAGAAVIAMLGVLLNLLLGLSRVVLAMGRRGDMPPVLAHLYNGQPIFAVLFCAAIIGILCMLGDVVLAWSFSALTVLSYYALTNIAALRMPVAERIFPAAISWAGLAGSLALAVFIPFEYWLWSGAALVLGAVWYRVRRFLAQ